ncbi:MAG: abortive infection family protein [Gammaproteobacteria bacterium]|nr:abortive infection family protein [Gammaproteobacteria bacterium]
MERVRREIKRIQKYRLEYYNSLLDVIERYVDEKPDITIETCKSVIEGVSKLVIASLKQEPLHVLDEHRDFRALFKQALSTLEDKDRSFDADLTKRLGSIVHYLAELRNQHGDISHGRASFKEQVNDADLSEMVIGMTDSLCTYMLRKLDVLTEDELRYDKNEAFNNYLDDLYPLDRKVMYSKALFEQEPETYAMYLGDYTLENNPEET